MMVLAQQLMSICRGTEEEEELEARCRKVATEGGSWQEFSYHIVTGNQVTKRTVLPFPNQQTFILRADRSPPELPRRQEAPRCEDSGRGDALEPPLLRRRRQKRGAQGDAKDKGADEETGGRLHNGKGEFFHAS